MNIHILHLITNKEYKPGYWCKDLINEKYPINKVIWSYAEWYKNTQMYNGNKNNPFFNLKTYPWDGNYTNPNSKVIYLKYCLFPKSVKKLDICI